VFDIYSRDAYLAAMEETEFLEGYDPKAFAPVAVAVDLVAFAVINRSLCVLLIKRREHPARGRWALPGSILQPIEDLDDCAARTAREKASIERGCFRQFRAFGAPQRDPRLRVVSVGYMGLVLGAALRAIADDTRRIARLRLNGDETSIRGDDNRSIALAFDHDEIVVGAVATLRADLDRTTDAFALLPEEFTLRDLQIVHEAIRGEEVNKPAFRKRMLDSGRLEPVGRKDEGGAHRPAELYRLREGAR
jgi:8-oxo-dGTP diphosphatase